MAFVFSSPSTKASSLPSSSPILTFDQLCLGQISDPQSTNHQIIPNPILPSSMTNPPTTPRYDVCWSVVCDKIPWTLKTLEKYEACQVVNIVAVGLYKIPLNGPGVPDGPIEERIYLNPLITPIPAQLNQGKTGTLTDLIHIFDQARKIYGFSQSQSFAIFRKIIPENGEDRITRWRLKARDLNQFFLGHKPSILIALPDLALSNGICIPLATEHQITQYYHKRDWNAVTTWLSSANHIIMGLCQKIQNTEPLYYPQKKDKKLTGRVSSLPHVRWGEVEDWDLL